MTNVNFVVYDAKTGAISAATCEHPDQYADRKAKGESLLVLAPNQHVDIVRMIVDLEHKSVVLKPSGAPQPVSLQGSEGKGS